jgi:hypothetical protein
MSLRWGRRTGCIDKSHFVKITLLFFFWLARLNEVIYHCFICGFSLHFNISLHNFHYYWWWYYWLPLAHSNFGLPAVFDIALNPHILRIVIPAL